MFPKATFSWVAKSLDLWLRVNIMITFLFFSLSASQYCQDFVCSVVLGEDLIPRLGIHTMEEFKTHILQAIQDCDWPKVGGIY